MTFMTRMAGRTAIGAAMLIGLVAPSAQAGYVVDLTQEAGGVLATGGGRIDLTGLIFQGNGSDTASLLPDFGQVSTGPAFPPTISPTDVYFGITGPESFGSGTGAAASSGSGELVGIVATTDHLETPHGYVSDAFLSDTSTYSGATFASLGVKPGRYEWSWGSGANQNFTLVIGTVPESSTWAMMLLGFAGLGLAGYRARAAATSNG
jgi:hypothetical protein